jgi:microsomal dipeptidase-like Zn-dependent dipeptidase
VTGFADIHTHQFAYLGFGGLAFHGRAFGELSEALPWCDYLPGTVPPFPRHGPGGSLDFIGNLLKSLYGSSIAGHRVGGYPAFDGWPRWDSVTHQSMYEDWLYRGLEGGLRLIVVLAVNSEFLCSRVYRTLCCNDMEAVDRQLAAAREMEAYIDDKNGGPGRGWYRIVSSPAEARATITAGKLAVILGIEVDYLFGSQADLTADHVRRELDKYFELGVRHIFPIHFGDNAFGGTAFQNGLVWDAGHPSGPVNPPPTVPAYVINTEDASSAGYEYRTGRRNIRGLTELGRLLIAEMIARGMIIDVDHMSARCKADVFDMCEATNYPVVSSHAGFVEICRGDKRHEGQLLPEEVERIRKLGGMIAPIVHQGDLDQIAAWEGPGQTFVPHTCGNTSNTVIQAYQYAVSKMHGAAVALGSDFNGFAGLPGPRFGPDACPGGLGDPPPSNPLVYPFKAAATGAELERSVVADRVFDINVDGLAHIGMLPDLVGEFEAQGLRPDELRPLLRSAEGYVRVWELALRRGLGSAAQLSLLLG